MTDWPVAYAAWIVFCAIFWLAVQNILLIRDCRKLERAISALEDNEMKTILKMFGFCPQCRRHSLTWWAYNRRCCRLCTFVENFA